MAEKAVLAVTNALDALAVRAAARLAAHSINGLLQFAREGDNLKVVGTECHVALIVTARAEFWGWPDGFAVECRGGVNVKSASKALRSTFILTVEGQDEPFSFEISSEDDLGLTACWRGTSKSPADLSSLDNIDGAPSEVTISRDVLSLISKLVAKLDETWSWRLSTHSGLRAFELVANHGRHRIVAMPCRSEE